MKYSALKKDGLREIKKSLGRFISIALLIALSVFVYVGLRCTGPSMRKTSSDFFVSTKLYDVKVSGDLLLTDKDVSILRSLDEIESIEAIKTVDVMDKNLSTILRVQQLPEKISTLKIMEGESPKQDGEILLDYSLKGRYSLGDIIYIDTKKGNANFLRLNDFKVVGFALNPEYLSLSDKGLSNIGDGILDGFGAVLKKDFSTDYYSYINIRFNMPRGIDREAAGNGYKKFIDNKMLLVEDALNPRPVERYKEVTEKVEEDVESGENKINDARKKLVENEKKLKDADAELRDSWEKYNKSEKDFNIEINNANKTLADKESKINESKSKIENGKNEIKKGEDKLLEARRTLEAKKRELEDSGKFLDEGKIKIDEGKQKIETSEKEISEKKAQLSSARNQIESGLSQVDAGKNKILEGIDAIDKQLQSGLKEIDLNLAAAKSRLSELQTKLDSAKEEEKPQIRLEIESLNQNIAALEQSRSEAISKAESAKSELRNKLEQLSGSEYDIRSKLTELSDGENEIKKAESKINEAKKELEVKENEYFQSKQKYEKGKVDLEDAERELNSKSDDLKIKKDEILKAELELKDGENKLAEARKTLDDKANSGRIKLSEAKKKIEDGEKKYKDAKKEFDDAKAAALKDIEDGEIKISDAKKKINRIEIPKYDVKCREDSVEFQTSQDGSRRMDIMSFIFPVLFFLVALLVALTTTTRMVEEQRTQIGTKKALGYSNGLIASKYLGYCALSSIIGWFLGTILGFAYLPRVVSNAYFASMIFKYFIKVVPVPLSKVFSLLLALSCTALAAYFSLAKELKENSAMLMRPEAPKGGSHTLIERIPFIWNNLSFSRKLAFRNVMRYKKRLFMTLFGVMGCTALMFMGFGIKNSLTGIVERQFGYLTKYDLYVRVENRLEKKAKLEIENFLRESGDVKDYTLITKTGIFIRKENGINQTVQVVAPSDENSFKRFVNLEARGSDKQFELEDNSLIISEKLASLLDVKVGDKLSVEGYDFNIKDLKVSGIVENYINHFIYLTEKTYKDVTGNTASGNTFMVRLNDNSAKSVENFTNKCLSKDGVKYVLGTSYYISAINATLKSLRMVIFIIVMVACLLAMVVLYNLTNINISERMRELCTLKVLGYHTVELSLYVYRETMMLTVMGILLGYGAGFIIHQLIIYKIIPDYVMMITNPGWRAYVYSAILTICFSALVMYLMQLKLRKINMIESLKSVE